MSPLLPDRHRFGISAGQKEFISATVAKLSPTFIPNAGQIDAPAQFYTRNGGSGFYFTPSAVNMAFIEPPARQNGLGRCHRHFRQDKSRQETDEERRGLVLSLRFIDANPAVTIEGQQVEPGSVNFFIGNDPAKWRTGLSSYGEISYRGLWPDVDLVFRKNENGMKYEFILQPGVDPSIIRLVYEGAISLTLDDVGNLLVHTSVGVLTDKRPTSYQKIAGRRVPVASRYVLEKGSNVWGFAVDEEYDLRYPLVIDPGLVYSTYLGGSNSDQGFGIAVDAAGNAYVTGLTLSSNFPFTPEAFQTNFQGGLDAFVTKLNPAGTAPVYSTFLGGSSIDVGNGITIDAAGNAYVTGLTASDNFPTTLGAFQTNFQGAFDAFVTKLDPSGASLIYSTYLGGSASDEGEAITIDAAGNAYVVGVTNSTTFPTTPGAFQASFQGGAADSFVTKLNATGTGLVYSTYLGGSGDDYGFGIKIDVAGNAYVTGLTNSTDFPHTAGAFQTTFQGGSYDAFVTKLNSAGTGLVYSTYLGGAGEDEGTGIAIDVSGNAYVTGLTNSTDFPHTVGAFQTTFQGGSYDAFVTKLNPAGTGLVYSTYLGGNDDDEGFAITIDADGNAYLTGQTSSTNFPTTTGAFQTSFQGGATDSFVTRLNTTGTALIYSTYLGGSGDDDDSGIAVDTSGNVYVAGYTDSTDFPTTSGAFQPNFQGFVDAVVTKLSTPTGCSLIIIDPDSRRKLGLDTPNGPDNPVPDSACHDICVREVTMIASTEVHQSFPYPPIGSCRLGTSVPLPPLIPGQQCSLYITCADEVLGPDCASVINTIGMLAICTFASGSVVAVPLTLVLSFSVFFDFPSCTRLFYSEIQKRLREIDGFCKIIQLRAQVNTTADAIIIEGKVVDKLWKHENLWISGLRPYDLSQEQREQGFISITVDSPFVNSNQAITPCP